MQDLNDVPAVLAPDELLQSAVSEAGTADFGPPDIREPLSILIDSLNHEAHLSPTGAAGQRATLHRALVNRLRIQESLNQHPEIREEAIKGPIVIVGLPRSGTTKLQRMMAADPGLQKLPLWKIVNPAPFPGTVPGNPDPRLTYCAEMIERMRKQAPKFYAAHPMLAQEPDEEVFLMLMTFLCSVPMHGARTPSYRAWLVAQDCRHWYPYLKLLLQYFQWQDGSHAAPWVLKAPWHFRWMKRLFDIFPGTTVVHCYREPSETVPSMCSLFEESRKLASDFEHPLEIGELVMDYWVNATRTFVRERAELGMEHRFVDVQYRDIVASPEDAIRRVYAAAGLALSDAAVRAMREWVRENPQHKHGIHRYSVERYGISLEDIEAGFGTYAARFRETVAELR